jgi:hypothetical protein
MRVTNADLRSEAWRHHCQDLEERLGELLAQLSVLGLDELQTEAIRGRIAEVKKWLALRPSDGSAGDIMAGLIEPGSRGNSH